MAESIDGLFEKIPLEEAYKQIQAYQDELLDYKSQGAVLNGTTELDKKYMAVIKTFTEYCSQFNEAELNAIAGKALQDM